MKVSLHYDWTMHTYSLQSDYSLSKGLEESYQESSALQTKSQNTDWISLKHE